MTGCLITKNLKSGKSYYYVKLSYSDPSTGARRQKMISTGLIMKGNKRKAEAFMQKAIHDNLYLEEKPVFREDGVDGDVKLCEYAQAWLEDKSVDGIEPSTVEIYTYRVKHIVNYFGRRDPKIKDLTPFMIDRFCKDLLKGGKTNQKTGEKEPLSPRTVADIKVILAKVLDQAVVDGVIPFNPAASVKVGGKRKKDYESEMIFLTEEECREFIAFLAKSEDPELRRLAPMAFLAIYYGFRRSEFLGLKWSAIDFDKKLIHIRHTVVYVKTIRAKDKTKTKNSRRSLSLFKTAEDVLQKVREEQEENKAFFGKEYKNRAGYVFTWDDGRYYDPHNVSQKFKRALTDFGRPELTLHKLRHTCASLLIEKGWDPKRVQYWLGHSDIQTTLNIYAHYNRQKMNQSSDDLDEIAGVCKDLF